MKAKFSSSKSFEDTQKFSKNPTPGDLIDILQFPPNEWVSMRAVGPVFAVGGHWLNTEKPKKGKMTKAFYKPCLAFDPQTEERDSTKNCPYCKDDSDWIRPDLIYWQNFIIRSLEEDEPNKKKEHTKSERKTGFKEKGSKSWTPVRAVRLTGGSAREVKKISLLNRHTSKKTGNKKPFPISHPKYGCDIEMMYSPEEAPAKKYAIQKGDKNSLTEDQEEYLCQNIEVLFKPESPEEAKAEYKRWSKNKEKITGGDDEDDDEEDEDEDRMSKKSKKSDSKKGKKKSKHDDDEDDSDDEDEDDEDNEFESDKKKSKKKKKSKRDEDEDDEDDEEDDSDDEDEEDDDD